MDILACLVCCWLHCACFFSLKSNYTRTQQNSFIKSGSPTRVVKMQSASNAYIHNHTHAHTLSHTRTLNGNSAALRASALFAFATLALSLLSLDSSLSLSSSCCAVHLSLCSYLIAAPATSWQSLCCVQRCRCQSTILVTRVRYARLPLVEGTGVAQSYCPFL